MLAPDATTRRERCILFIRDVFRQVTKMRGFCFSNFSGYAETHSWKRINYESIVLLYKKRKTVNLFR